MEPTQWLNGSFAWDPAALQARPAKPAPQPPRKAAGGGPVCQVEGCGVDLGGLRYFFRKQRICEQHARADVVTDMAGRQLRFCQQCTRLEPLTNFNAGRRSCKTSLAKRQARAHRGKAHSSPDSSPERTGAQPAGRGSSSSDGEGAASSGKGSSRRSGGAGLSSKRSRSSPAPSGAGSPGAAAMNSGSSGLPSPAPQALAPQPAPARQPALPLPAQGPADMLWSSSLCDNDIEDLLAMDPEALADALLVPSGLAQRQPSAAPQPAPAPTPGPAAPPAPAAATPMTGSPWGVMPTAQPASSAAHGFGAATDAFAGMPATPNSHWPAAATALHAAPDFPALQAAPQAAPQAAQQEWAAAPEALQVAAMQRQASGVPSAVQQLYPMHVITRFSLKIFGVNPDHLPQQLRSELLAALQVSPTVLEGAIRCGCTHVVVDVLLSCEERRQLATAQRLAAAVQHIRRPDVWRGRPASPAIVAQLGQLVALGTAFAGAEASCDVHDMPLPCIHMGASQLLPRLELAGPVATTTSASAGTFHLAAAVAQADAAHFPVGLAAALRCRCHGKHVGLAVSALRSGEPGSDSEEEDGEEAPPPEACVLAQEQGLTVLQAWAPDAASGEGWGLYEFEVSSGSLLSDPVPVLVLPDACAAAASELCQLQQQQQQQRGPPGDGPTCPATIVRLVAAVLRYLQHREAAAAAGPSTAVEAAFHAAYPPPATAKLAAVAQRLVSLAVRARWPAVARLLLPAIRADGSSTAAAVRQLDALSAPAPSLLHLAVASGNAATLAALRSWAGSQGPAWAAANGGAESAVGSPSLLLLAAGMGDALEATMVDQLRELLGDGGLVQAADAAGPSGWTPRRVAAETGNVALLAVLPPEPEPEPAVPPLQAGTSMQDEELDESQRLQASRKLRALEEDWAPSYPSPTKRPLGAAAAAATHSKVRVGTVMGSKARRQLPVTPSHDATLLASLLREMDVPLEAPTHSACSGASQHSSQAAADAAADGFQRIAQQFVASSLAGATAAVVAALASLALRMAV